jgi:hypothetical protein
MFFLSLEKSQRFEGWIILDLKVKKKADTYSVGSGRPSYSYYVDLCLPLLPEDEERSILGNVIFQDF